jgi:hypothetical protein
MPTAPAALEPVQASAPPEVWGCEFESAPCDVPMAERMQRLLKVAKSLKLRCTFVGNSVEHPLIEPVELVEE